MQQITDVTRHLLIINVLMFFGTMFMGDPAGMQIDGSTELSDYGRLMLAVFYPTSEFFQPFQIITHMFMHGDIGHLFFNMFALYMFGPPLEALWGEKKFLFYYLITGFGALALHMLVMYYELQSGSIGPSAINVPMLGASGAVFGLLAGFGLKYPDTKLMLLFPPIPIKAKYFVVGYAVIELMLGLSPYQTGIAHFAHLGGALFGFLLIQFWDKTGSDFLNK